MKNRASRITVRLLLCINGLPGAPALYSEGLLLSEFVEGSLKDNFYKAHNLKGLNIADPFMGGGTPLIEANRLGCDVSPMAYWIVRQEIEHLDLEAYREAAADLQESLARQVGSFIKLPA